MGTYGRATQGLSLSSAVAGGSPGIRLPAIRRFSLRAHRAPHRPVIGRQAPARQHPPRRHGDPTHPDRRAGQRPHRIGGRTSSDRSQGGAAPSSTQRCNHPRPPRGDQRRPGDRAGGLSGPDRGGESDDPRPDSGSVRLRPGGDGPSGPATRSTFPARAASRRP